MPSIFPPVGPHDEARFQSVKREEREYLWFCLEFCGRILDRRPSHLEALEMAANHYTELGYYNDGLMLDERLADLRPGDPGILYNLACSLALTGRVDDAILTLSRAVQNGYGDHRHMAADRDLAPVRDDPRFRQLIALMETRSIGGGR